MGKYLIPEEWYNIISYRYGKKKYLNKRKSPQRQRVDFAKTSCCVSHFNVSHL
ncbi:MAG: hypothetical protein J5661_00295 [Bacteroidaceae bacterium]|nr:hypothetical protein [Bacteroidaceae bacterium]